MRGALAVLLIASVVHADELAPPDEVAAFEREHIEAERQELHILGAVAIEGAISLGAGVGLVTSSSHDDGLRVAGGLDMGFGFVNVALSASVIPLMLYSRRRFDREHDQRLTVAGLAAARRKDATYARRQSTLYAINLGLDAGYLFAGVASVVASQQGISHSDRWLGAGITLCAQSVFAAAVDLASLLISNRRQARILASLTPSFSIAPTPGGTRTTVGVLGRF